MKYSVPKSNSAVYNFNLDWHFKKADAFPLDAALEKHKDINGRYFYEPEYIENSWDNVSLPHTFNDEDAFVSRIEDAGSGQSRTFSFYRKNFTIPANHKDKKVIIEFEGVRQSCFLYINGTMAGYYESGVCAFGFDLTAYVNYDGENIIAIATDNTATRNVDKCMAETPNKPDITPGYYMAPLTSNHNIPENRQGIGFEWNCNDFNPSFGGISKNVRLHIKDRIYQTLPLYSNLMTKGVYIYPSDFDIQAKNAIINVESELRNETNITKNVNLEVVIVNHKGEMVSSFVSENFDIEPSKVPEKMPLSITPEDAYIYDEKLGRYVPVEDEDAVKPTITNSYNTSIIKVSKKVENLRFWSNYDPYLYDIYCILKSNDEVLDITKITTGFRKVSYDKDKGLLINDSYVWLTGYAQRATNEWAAIGVAPDWLKDFDAQLIKESNANFIRWMHVAACPADIRSCDKHGIICVQPAGDKEREAHGRQWDQRVELMRDVIIYFRNNPSIVFWETGNNAVSKEHMREMTLLKKELDPTGGRYMGCRTISTIDVVQEAEFVGTMLNRYAARFQSNLMPIVETEYLRDEAPRRVWDDFSPPDFDYNNKYLGKHGKKQVGGDYWDQTAEDFALSAAMSYSEFFNDRVGGVSERNLYSTAAALCWTDSAQHGRQAFSENARMSGRVDAVRVKKQNFYVFQTIQANTPAVMIFGHWNYPKQDGINYKYEEKEFKDGFWLGTGVYNFRNPKHKTVYVIANAFVSKVELYINNSLVGTCNEPKKTFIYEFPDIDITQSGNIYAKAYDRYDNFIAEHKIETTGEPASIRLTPITGSKGLIADGSDVAAFDVEVLDNEGRLCPLCYDRIDFTLSGEAKFLGGYNSGKFNGYGKNDSVIHQNHVFAECGNNRVFIRSTRNAGKITLTATMENLPATTVSITSNSIETLADTGLCEIMPQEIYFDYPETAPSISPYEILQNMPKPVNYIVDTKKYYKIVVNGRETDMRGSNKVYEQTGIFGPIIPVLEDIYRINPNLFEYNFDISKNELTLKCNGNTIVAAIGKTHLLVNGEENLMNGEPEYHEDNIFCMEINTMLSYIKGITVSIDENIQICKVTV